MKKMQEIQKKLKQFDAGPNSLQNIQKLLERLTNVFFKEQQMEYLVDKFKGFIEYFEEQWAKINKKILNQNSFISKNPASKKI